MLPLHKCLPMMLLLLLPILLFPHYGALQNAHKEPVSDGQQKAVLIEICSIGSYGKWHKLPISKFRCHCWVIALHGGWEHSRTLSNVLSFLLGDVIGVFHCFKFSGAKMLILVEPYYMLHYVCKTSQTCLPACY